MIILKTLNQIDKIRKSCNIAAYILNEIHKHTIPGVTPLYLNNLTETICLEKGCHPGVKGYRNYPYALCCSKNNVIVHGFPDNTPLVNGDIISFDLGINCNGWWGDAAITVPVGNISKNAAELLHTTYECLCIGRDRALPNNRIGDISCAVQTTANKYHMSVIKEFVGHGVGKDLHEHPQIPNLGIKGEGIKIKPGMVLAIEPILSTGNGEIITLSDGWNVVTKDNSLSAHFEQTILVTSDGYEILTRLD